MKCTQEKRLPEKYCKQEGGQDINRQSALLLFPQGSSTGGLYSWSRNVHYMKWKIYFKFFPLHHLSFDSAYLVLERYCLLLFIIVVITSFWKSSAF